MKKIYDNSINNFRLRLYDSDFIDEFIFVMLNQVSKEFIYGSITKSKNKIELHREIKKELISNGLYNLRYKT